MYNQSREVDMSVCKVATDVSNVLGEQRKKEERNQAEVFDYSVAFRHVVSFTWHSHGFMKFHKLDRFSPATMFPNHDPKIILNS
jgi:hypothetical protein